MKPSERINQIIVELQEKHGVQLTSGVLCTAIIKHLDEQHEIKQLIEAPKGLKL